MREKLKKKDYDYNLESTRSLLWIYISKHLDALDLKIEEFLDRFRESKIVHSRRVCFEELKNQLTQVSLFNDATHFVFEDFAGSFTDVEKLFKEIEITSTVLITKLVEQKSILNWSLIERLEDRNYLLYKTSLKSREKYLSLILKRENLNLSENHLSLIKKEGLNSSIQIRGIVSQMKYLMNDESINLDNQLVREIISSNNVVESLEDKWYFLEWYFTGKIREWYLFLKKVESSSTFVQEFLRSICSAINFNFWDNRHNPETLSAVRKLGYNFFIFIESELFKIKSGSFYLVTYFFWKNRPWRPLLWL